jgi:ADP-ribose pyrophosphatase YjhB (NUDIX family)
MMGNSKEVPFSPTDSFRFCPADGARLGEARASGGTTCPECGRSWYRNSAPTVGAAIVRDAKALVTVRGIEPEKGRVDVPGGFLEVGEHPVDGLKREAREELGVEIEVVGDPVSLAIHNYGEDGIYVLAMGFKARIVDGEPEPADDVAEIRWISSEEVDDLDFAWKHDREFVWAALNDGE